MKRIYNLILYYGVRNSYTVRSNYIERVTVIELSVLDVEVLPEYGITLCIHVDAITLIDAVTLIDYSCSVPIMILGHCNVLRRRARADGASDKQQEYYRYDVFYFLFHC